MNDLYVNNKRDVVLITFYNSPINGCACDVTTVVLRHLGVQANKAKLHIDCIIVFTFVKIRVKMVNFCTDFCCGNCGRIGWGGLVVVSSTASKHSTMKKIQKSKFVEKLHVQHIDPVPDRFIAFVDMSFLG